MRWLVLDEVISVEKGKKSFSRSRVPATGKAGEPPALYSAEFLMIEMMAQTGALLVGAENDFSEDLVFAKVELAEFFPGYASGEEIKIESSAEQVSSAGGWLEAKIENSCGLIAKSKLLLMNVGHLISGQTVSVTFHKQFMEHFEIRSKVK